MAKSAVKTKPIFIPESELSIIRFSAHQSSSLRSKLDRGIYWLQPIPRGKVHWHEKLLSDYLLNGDRPEHQRLVEEHIATLPKVA